MARRRRGESEVPGDVPVEVPAGDGQPQIEVRMRGGADDVKRQLGVAMEEKPAAVPQGPDDDKKKFVDSLRNSRYIIRVKRTTPREFGGVKTNVEVWSTELPMGYQEIQDEIAKECGGGKYRVAIIDPASNNTIAADTFEVGGNPIIPETEMSQEEQDRIFLAGRPKSTAELNTESLERRALLLTKQAEVESIEAELEAARERRKQSKMPAPAQDDRIIDLDRRLTEARHQADLEARDRKHAEEMRELKALIAQNAKPAKENDGMTILLEQMRADRKASDDRFNAMMKQMQDDKMTALLEEVKSIKNKPQGQSGSLLEQAEAMLKLRKIFGWGDEDEDEEDDVDDKRPWWERALDKLGGKFGDKLLAKFTDMEEKGQTVDRETFMKGMGEYADQVAAEAVSRATAPAQGKPHALPPPPAVAPALPPPPPPAAPGSVSELPPPPPAPPPAAPVATPPIPTIEQEIAIRVGGVLELFSREIILRPNDYNWTYEGCWSSLPEEVLEKVCAAPDIAGVIDALTVNGMDPGKIAELKEKVASSPRILAWATKGLNELKAWAIERQKDPTFEPFSDEDEDGGEGAVE